MLKKLRAAGFDRVMGNLYLPTLQILNAYAFGRFTISLETDPLAVLSDFARLIAHPEDAERLRDVLCWLDNHSYWNEQLPDDARESDFSCPLNKESARPVNKYVVLTATEFSSPGHFPGYRGRTPLTNPHQGEVPGVRKPTEPPRRVLDQRSRLYRARGGIHDRG